MKHQGSKWGLRGTLAVVMAFGLGTQLLSTFLLHTSLQSADQDAEVGVSRTSDMAQSAEKTRKFDVSPPKLNSTCIRFMTFATKSNGNLCKLLRTAAMAGIELHVLGHGTYYAGFHVKLPATLHAVSSLPPDCVVVFVDGYDVLFARVGPEEILKRYRALTKHDSSKQQVIFSAECNCLVHNKTATPCDDFPPSPRGVDVRFPNTGGYIGEAGAVARFLSLIIHDIEVANQAHPNDQAFSNEQFRKPEVREEYGLGVDFHSTIFQALAGGDNLPYECSPLKDFKQGTSFKNGRWIDAKHRRKTPAIVHFNGPSKFYLGEWYHTWWQWHASLPQEERVSDAASVVWVGDKRSSIAEVCASPARSAP